jgi:hypothetical protein
MKTQSCESLLGEFLHLLLGSVFDLAAFQQALTLVIALQLFLNFFVAFHVSHATDSCGNVSDHEELRTPASSDSSIRKTLRLAVVFHVLLEELQRFLVVEVAATSERSTNCRKSFKLSTGIRDLFGS